MIKKTVQFILGMAVSALAFAQTADELDVILNSRELSAAQAARFVLTAANVPPGNGDAFSEARARGYLPGRTKPDNPIRLGELSLLIMRSFDLKGGILYTLFPGPRYANREMVYLRLVQGRTDPQRFVDGGTFLQILGRTLTFTGEDAALAGEKARRRLLEDVTESLREDARQVQGIPSGIEDIQGYEGGFELE